MPTCGDYIMHFLTLFWKVIFATIPPAGTSLIFDSFFNSKNAFGSEISRVNRIRLGTPVYCSKLEHQLGDQIHTDN